MYDLEISSFASCLDTPLQAVFIISTALLLLRSCWPHGECCPAVKTRQGVLKEKQDSMPETERYRKLGAYERKIIFKKIGPSKDFISTEVTDKGETRKEQRPSKGLYPVKDSKALEPESSEGEGNSKEEAARYEEKRIHLDEGRADNSGRRPERLIEGQMVPRVLDPGGRLHVLGDSGSPRS